MKNWTYNEELDTWVCGTQAEGGGVFLDKPLSKTRKTEVWTGNAVYGNVINNIGDCKTKGQAMSKVEAELKRLKEQG